MPRPRYQITDEDIPVVHRWVHTKCRDTLWPQHAAAHAAWDQVPRTHPTATQLQQWCDQYLDARQWTQLQAVIRAARHLAGQTRTVRLSTSAYRRLHDLAAREQLTLSAAIERYLSEVTATSPPPVLPPTPGKQPPKPKTPDRATQQAGRAAALPQKRRSAFITTKKGVCYLTITSGRGHFPLMRIRNYTIDAQDKRDMRRRHPDVDFDWKKIARQLAEKREVCRQYRARRRTPRRPREPREPFYGVIDPVRRTVSVNDPSNILGVGALLDQMIADDRWREAEGPSRDEPGQLW